LLVEGHALQLPHFLELLPPHTTVVCMTENVNGSQLLPQIHEAGLHSDFVVGDAVRLSGDERLVRESLASQGFGWVTAMTRMLGRVFPVIEIPLPGTVGLPSPDGSHGGVWYFPTTVLEKDGKPWLVYFSVDVGSVDVSSTKPQVRLCADAVLRTAAALSLADGPCSLSCSDVFTEMADQVCDLAAEAGLPPVQVSVRSYPEKSIADCVRWPIAAAPQEMARDAGGHTTTLQRKQRPPVRSAARSRDPNKARRRQQKQQLQQLQQQQHSQQRPSHHQQQHRSLPPFGAPLEMMRTATVAAVTAAAIAAADVAVAADSAAAVDIAAATVVAKTSDTSQKQRVQTPQENLSGGSARQNSQVLKACTLRGGTSEASCIPAKQAQKAWTPRGSTAEDSARQATHIRQPLLRAVSTPSLQREQTKKQTQQQQQQD